MNAEMDDRDTLVAMMVFGYSICDTLYVDTSIEIICLTTLWTGPVTCIYMYIIHTFSRDYDVMYT